MVTGPLVSPVIPVTEYVDFDGSGRETLIDGWERLVPCVVCGWPALTRAGPGYDGRVVCTRECWEVRA